MTSFPANLGQRILDAARIATAMHEESLRDQLVNLQNAGGAGRGGSDQDGAISTDRTPPAPDPRGARVR